MLESTLKLTELFLLLLSSLPSILFWYGTWWIWDHSVSWSISNSTSLPCQVKDVPSSFVEPWIFLSVALLLRSILDLGASLSKISDQGLFRVLVLKIFLVIQSFLAVLLWKCVFDTLHYMECYFVFSGYTVAIFLFPCLILLKATRTLIGNPAILLHDSIHIVYRVPTALRTDEIEDSSLKFTLVRFLDHLFSNILNLIPAVIWWAVWEVTDTSLKTQYEWIYMISGYLLIVMAYRVEQVYFQTQTSDCNADRYCLRLTYICVTIIAFLGSILVWRGGWGILDLLESEHSGEVHILLSLIGLTTMLSFNVGNTLTNRGFERDLGRDIRNWKVVVTPNRNYTQ
eukprot:TRINITY_DN4500_c0_g1_i2.p1 TRINITY_DN4500_c0_g1~~TRINITY_DN4500_c0_g1_i2.p1  ORF type:complete len:342 (+),score=-6.09 TRINITY_DN4500_c0_g1_i2:138-1163(+)